MFPTAALFIATGTSGPHRFRQLYGGDYNALWSDELTEWQADRLATRAGLHPSDVWPDWWDRVALPREDREHLAFWMLRRAAS